MTAVIDGVRSRRHMRSLSLPSHGTAHKSSTIVLRCIQLRMRPFPPPVARPWQCGSSRAVPRDQHRAERCGSCVDTLLLLLPRATRPALTPGAGARPSTRPGTCKAEHTR